MRRRALSWALVAATTALEVTRASAQAPEITVDDAVQLVREESPTARALRAQIAVADAEIDLAGVYPNPVLQYVGMGRFDGSAQAINGSQHQVWVDVPLLIAGQHDARRDVAAASAVAARADLELELIELETGARRAFASMLAAQQRIQALEQAREELDALRGVVEGRAGAGAQSSYDLARIVVEVARVDADLAVARADRRTASANLAGLAGRVGWDPRAHGDLEVGSARVGVVDDLPAVRAARLRAQAAEREVRRADLDRIPEIRVGLGAYMTTDGDSGSFYGGLIIPLPVFDTGEAAVRRASAARDAAEETRAAVEARAQAALDGALAALDARRAALETFDLETLARIPELQRMGEAAYRLGAAEIFELLDGFRARLELALARIELLEAAVQAEIDVRALAGR